MNVCITSVNRETRDGRQRFQVRCEHGPLLEVEWPSGKGARATISIGGQQPGVVQWYGTVSCGGAAWPPPEDASGRKRAAADKGCWRRREQGLSWSRNLGMAHL